MIETEDIPTPLEKALAINLDPLKYGTVVEIGAGQEVARWFFQAGAAAGTVAKTMSAYDMKFSDEIYGVEPDGRYVSRSRLDRMLEHEFSLITERLVDHRPDGSQFFAFANTVTAQGFKKRDECHGWIGVRLQLSPKAPPDDIVLHVRMLDDTNREQQDALGILGMNLIHGAYFYADRPEKLLSSLMDNLKWGCVEIDLIEFCGPTLGKIDNRLMALELVKASLVRAVMFDPDGEIVIPAEALYKRPVLAMRGAFNPVRPADLAMFEGAKSKFTSALDSQERPPVLLAEMTTAHLANEGAVDTNDFLSRVSKLTSLGFHVLISEFFRYFRVRQYLARYSRQPVGIVMDIDGFRNIIQPDLYDGLAGGMLEGLGQLLPQDTTVYVCSRVENGKRIRLDDVSVADQIKPLVSYLQGLELIVPIDDIDSE